MANISHQHDIHFPVYVFIKRYHDLFLFLYPISFLVVLVVFVVVVVAVVAVVAAALFQVKH